MTAEIDILLHTGAQTGAIMFRIMPDDIQRIEIGECPENTITLTLQDNLIHPKIGDLTHVSTVTIGRGEIQVWIIEDYIRAGNVTEIQGSTLNLHQDS